MNRYLTQILILLLVISGVGIYFYAIGEKALWIDELATIYNAYDLNRLTGTIMKQETNMWLYFFILHFWMKLGDSSTIVRIFSAIFTIASIPVIYLLGKEVLNKKVGVIAAGFFTFHWVTLYFAQEARSYALLIFFSLLSSLYFLRSIKNSSRKNVVFYTIFSIATIYSHTFAILLIASQTCYLLFFERTKRNLLMFFSSWTIIGASILPLLYSEKQVTGGLLDWIWKTEFKHLYVLLVYFSSLSKVVLVIFSTLFLIACWIILVDIRKNKLNTQYKKVFFLFLWLFIPIISIFLFSIFVKPLFINRYFYFCLVPFLLIVSIPFSYGKLKTWKIAFAVVIFLLLFNTQRLYFKNYEKQNLQQYTEMILNNYPKGYALVIYPDRIKKGIEYYKRNGPTKDDAVQMYYLPHNPVNRAFTEKELQENKTALQNISKRHTGIMLYMRLSDLDSKKSEKSYHATVEGNLKSLGYKKEKILLSTDIIVELYKRK